MSFRHGILILLLFFFVVLLGLKNYEIWTLPIGLGSVKGETKKTGAKVESPPATGGKKEPTAMESYIFVAEKNIFTPERKEFPVIAPPPVSEVKKPIVRPKVILYGVTMVEDYQSAFVTNPGRPLRKDERELMTLKIGDRVGDYKVAKILPDRITMEAEEDTFEVLLYDPKAPKQRTYVKTETKPAAVTSTLAPATPPPTSAFPPGAVAPVPPPTPGAPRSTPTPSRIIPPSPRLRRGSGASEPPQPNVPQQAPQPNIQPQSGTPPAGIPIGPQ